MTEPDILPTPPRTHQKVLRFLGIGVFNTLFNIFMFDILVFAFKFGDLWANFVSLVISIVISYFLNKQFVFKDQRQASSRQLTLFMVGTFIIQLSTQHLAVWLLGERYTAVGRAAHSLLSDIGLHFSTTFVVLNVAKGLGVAVAITISYLFYDRRVFRHHDEKTT